MVEVIALLLLRATFLHLFPIHYAERHDTPAGFALTETVPQASHDSQIIVTNILWDLRRNPNYYLADAGIPSGSWAAARYIFMRESTWRPRATNSWGCIGLGQDCNHALSAICPNWEGDVVCQIQYFNSYALHRYGSWDNAMTFWNIHNWW